MNTEKVILTVKEATKKQGEKTLDKGKETERKEKYFFWSIKNEKGLVYNAKIEDYAEINPGDILNAVFTTTEYEAKNGPNKGQMVKSRWLLKPGAEHVEKDPVEMSKTVFGCSTSTTDNKQAWTISNPTYISEANKIVAAILAICEDDVKALAKYREILGKL